MAEWANRITGTTLVDPEHLLANPRNWRIHPEAQQDALRGSLEAIGWVQKVIINERTGHIVDGHLRVMLALRDEIAQIPALYVDLSEGEERAALASLDTFTTMARANAYLFEQLLETLNTGHADLQRFLDERAQALGIVLGADNTGEGKEPTSGDEYGEDDFDGFDYECPCCGFQFNG